MLLSRVLLLPARSLMRFGIFAAALLPVAPPATAACIDTIRALVNARDPLTVLDQTRHMVPYPGADIVPGDSPRAVYADLRAYAGDRNIPLPAGAIELGRGGTAVVYRGPVEITGACYVGDGIIKVNLRLAQESQSTAYLFSANEYFSLLAIRQQITDPNEEPLVPEPMAIGWLRSGEANNVPGLVLRPTPNARSLSQMIDRPAAGAALGPTNVMAIGVAIAKALVQIHRARVHNDIKPDNMLLVGNLTDPKIIILDLAGAALRGEIGRSFTPRFLRPESLRNGVVTLSVDNDIYAAARSLEAVALRGDFNLTGMPSPALTVNVGSDIIVITLAPRSVYSTLLERPGTPAADLAAARLISPYLFFSEIFTTAGEMRAAFERLKQVGNDPLRTQEFLDSFAADLVRLFQAGDEAARIELAGKIVTSRELLDWITAPAGQPHLVLAPIAADLAAILRRFVNSPENDTPIRRSRRFASRYSNDLITAAANMLQPLPP